MSEVEFMNGQIKKNSRKIICLSGPRGCGKSTIANHLKSLLNYERVAFADSLREISAIFSSTLKSDRLFLAKLGAEIRTQLPDFFIQVMKRKIQNSESSLVIEDIRFLEELEFCKSIGAMTIRLEIPKKQQILNLEERGLEEHEALQVIECDDEKILNSNADWDYVVPAIGNFEDVAIQLDILAGECQ